MIWPTCDNTYVSQAKQALKEAPKDDEALDRQEDGEIDKGFTESSSSSEDELTEEGKPLQLSTRNYGYWIFFSETDSSSNSSVLTS